jgi:hypothetical protein
MTVIPTDMLLSKCNMELEHTFGLIMNSNHLNKNIKHFPSRLYSQSPMPYKEIIVFYSESHKIHTNEFPTELQKVKLNADVNWRYMSNYRIVWGSIDRASLLWNNVWDQLDATNVIYWCSFTSTCFGRLRPSSGALDRVLQLTVFCTQFVAGRLSGQPVRRPCVQCGGLCSSSTLHTVRARAPDYGRKYRKHVELKKHQ